MGSLKYSLTLLQQQNQQQTTEEEKKKKRKEDYYYYRVTYYHIIIIISSVVGAVGPSDFRALPYQLLCQPLQSRLLFLPKLRTAANSLVVAMAKWHFCLYS